MIEFHRKPEAVGFVNPDKNPEIIRDSFGWHEFVDGNDKRIGFVTYNTHSKVYTIMTIHRGHLQTTNECGLCNFLQMYKVKADTTALSISKSQRECKVSDIKVGDTFEMGDGEEYIVAGEENKLFTAGYIPCLTVGGLRPANISANGIAYPTNTVVSISH
ncbi:hypothetical protein VPHK469_0132 [Vibrio phage K469]